MTETSTTGTPQSGRTNSGLVALVGVAILLLFALGAQSILFRGLGFDFMGDRLFHGWRFFPYSLLGLGGILQVGLAIWVGYDAHKRGLNGFLWGLLVLFTFIVGLIVYLIVGPSMGRSNGPFSADWAPSTAPPVATPPAAAGVAASAPGFTADSGVAPGLSCPHCDAPAQPDFKVCPYCAGALRCAKCDGTLQNGWKVCPRCGTNIPQG